MSAAPDILLVGAAPAARGERHYRWLIRSARLVIAADAGLEACLAAGRTPDMSIGDFDSVDAALLERARSLGSVVRTFPVVKDESDLDLAVTAARELGGRLTICSAFTRRFDHSLASLGSLLRAADLHAEASEPQWHGYVLDAEHRSALALAEERGTVVSVIAPTGDAEVSLHGFAYPLERGRLRPLSSLGLSNLAGAEGQQVEVHEGRVVVIVNRVLPLSS